MNKHVRLDEKLAALQEADPYRKWSSLDDQRVCVLCDKIISGRMIDVWQDEGGLYRLHCPTPGCAAIPRDWFYYGTARPFPASGAKNRPPVLGIGHGVPAKRTKQWA